MKKIINYILIAVFIFTGVIGPVFLGMVEAQEVILEPAPMDTGDSGEEPLDTPATGVKTTEGSSGDTTTTDEFGEPLTGISDADITDELSGDPYTVDSLGEGATPTDDSDDSYSVESLDKDATFTDLKDVPALTTPTNYDEKLTVCDIWDGAISGCFVWGAYGITYLASEVLRLAGTVFNSILTFSLDSNTINQDFVEIVWGKLKDIAYSLFIILMVIIGISTIVGLKQFGSKEKVVTILAVAVAINFSLFFARVVVDTGNILGLSFYDAVSTYESTFFGKIEVKDLSGSLISTLNPSEIFSVENFTLWMNEVRDGDTTTTLIPNMALILIYLIAAGMMLYVAFVFLSVFFMLIARLLWIWVLMMTAPLAFLGLAIPQLKGLYGKWWKKLIDNAFSFVAFMFFIWVFMIIQKSNFFKSSDLLNATGASDWLKVVMVGFMKFAIMVTLLNHAKGMMKKMSGDGGIGDMAMGFAKTTALGVATGGLGLAAKNTLGRFAESRAAKMEKEGKVTTPFQKMRLQALRGVSGAKFGTKESFTGKREGIVKKHEEYTKGLKDVRDDTGKIIKTKADQEKEYYENLKKGSVVETMLGRRGGNTLAAERYHENVVLKREEKEKIKAEKAKEKAEEKNKEWVEKGRSKLALGGAVIFQRDRKEIDRMNDDKKNKAEDLLRKEKIVEEAQKEVANAGIDEEKKKEAEKTLREAQNSRDEAKKDFEDIDKKIKENPATQKENKEKKELKELEEKAQEKNKEAMRRHNERVTQSSQSV